MVDTSSENRFQEILHSLRHGKNTGVSERSGWKWFIQGSGEGSYSEYFSTVLEQGINALLEGRVSQGKQNFVLDLMADTGFVRDVSDKSDFGLAVGLGDGRSQEETTADKAINVDMVEGDLLHKATWQRIRKRFFEARKQLSGQTEHLSGFNLITCRPMGGAYNLTYDSDVHYWLIQQAYQLLSRDNGVLLTTASVGDDNVIREWVNEVNSANIGVHMRFSEPTPDDHPKLMLVKGKNAPRTLPSLKRLAPPSSPIPIP